MTAVRARARLAGYQPAGRMNRLEARYAEHLKLRQLAGEISDFRYEAVKLRLSTLAFYTPDFMVILPNGEVEMHETKGTWSARGQSTARLRIKLAAKEFPWFRFVAITKPARSSEWHEEEIAA